MNSAIVTGTLFTKAIVEVSVTVFCPKDDPGVIRIRHIQSHLFLIFLQNDKFRQGISLRNKSIGIN